MYTKRADFKVKQFSNVFNQYVVGKYLALMEEESYYGVITHNSDSQAEFEAVYLNGGSADKISAYYRYFKDFATYVYSSIAVDITDDMNVLDLLSLLSHGNRKFRLDSIINNIFIRYYAVDMINDLYYLCDGAMFNYGRFKNRLVEIYKDIHCDDDFEDNKDTIVVDIHKYFDILETFSQRTNEVFSDKTFEDACTYEKKIYLKTNIRALRSDKYKSKGLDYKASITLYYDLLERAKKNAFTMSFAENKKALVDYIRSYKTRDGVSCVYVNRTLDMFLNTLLSNIGLLVSYGRFVNSIVEGDDFDTLNKEYRLYNYNITNRDELINIINTRLVWLAILLPEDYATYICLAPYGSLDGNGTYTTVEDCKDDSGDTLNVDTVEDIEELEDVDEELEDTAVEEVTVDVKMASDGTLYGNKVVTLDDTKVTYHRDMVHSVVYAILIGDITYHNYQDKLIIDDMWSFIQDIVDVCMSIKYEDVRIMLKQFVNDITFNVH
jgi:hypothetical protein|nr:MAG TPA: hypothetical protein [Bacteriophage sp.]